jgi:gamma-glutamylcyclotransferase (GGCT)/AIG2-like uncharacterized protein YtfP
MLNCELLFVYGSLRRGFGAQGLMRRLRARYLGKGSVEGQLFDVGRFPAAVKAPRSRMRVVGELYRMPSANRSFLRLDQYEGRSYSRDLAEVELQNGKRTRAWIYWMKRVPASKRRIRGGDYATQSSEL